MGFLWKVFSSSLFILLIFTAQSIEKCHGQPTVSVKNTRIVGIDMITRNNRNISGFIGIPFAETPIGNLRFSNPVLKELPTGHLPAQKDGSMCPQRRNYPEKKVIGEEDCLFLNVFTPWKSFNRKNSLLPVMVLIHGSAYRISSSRIDDNLGPDYLLDKDIVLVSFNYRLDILGFLSTGDEVILGNFGIKDQLIALQWVQKYIRYFGGDPKQVTLVGHSAGADSVIYHASSNITEGYFQRYILQSGCPYSVRSFRDGNWQAKVAKRVAESFNCPSNSQLLVDCLRNIDYKTLLNNSFIFDSIEAFFTSSWSPTIEPKVEGAYITENPFDVLKQKKIRDLPAISGVDHDEGLHWTDSLYVNTNLYNKIAEDLDGFIISALNYFELTKNISLVASEIKSFYFNNEVSSDKNVVLKQLTNLTGDLLKIFPSIFSSIRQAEINKSPLYLYLFNYRGLISHTNSHTHNNLNIGVSHVEDIIYLFPHTYNVSVEFNEETMKKDSIMVDLMVDLWTSFIINGVPTSEKLSNGDLWKPYLPGSNILEIGNFSYPKTQIIHSVFKERMDFWERLQPMILRNFL